MRVLISCDPFIPVPPRQYGGIERIVASLVSELQRLGHDLALLGHEDSTAAVSRFFAWPTRGESGFDHLRNLRAYAAAISAFRPDVVHSFSRIAYLIPALRSGIPTVMSYQREISVRNARAARWMARGPIAFTACSNQLASKGRVSGGEWHGIHNFVALEQFDFVASVADDAPLLFLSRLDRIKGADRAISVARSAGIPLIIAGNRSETGPERDYFDREIAPHLDGHSVQWVGAVDDEQKNLLLGRARALLVPIRWEEPFGIVFAESLACGTPVISTPRGALPEIVRHGAHGFLAESESELVQSVRDLGRISRTECRNQAEIHFAKTPVVGKYVDLYQRLIQRGSEAGNP